MGAPEEREDELVVVPVADRFAAEMGEVDASITLLRDGD